MTSKYSHKITWHHGTGSTPNPRLQKQSTKQTKNKVYYPANETLEKLQSTFGKLKNLKYVITVPDDKLDKIKLFRYFEDLGLINCKSIYKKPGGEWAHHYQLTETGTHIIQHKNYKTQLDLIKDTIRKYYQNEVPFPTSF